MKCIKGVNPETFELDQVSFLYEAGDWVKFKPDFADKVQDHNIFTVTHDATNCYVQCYDPITNKHFGTYDFYLIHIPRQAVLDLKS